MSPRKTDGTALKYRYQTRILITALFLILLVLSTPIRVTAETVSSLICEEITPSASGVVLLIHGLNNAPSSLRSLRSSIRQQNFSTCQLRLSGHEVDSLEGESYASIWKAETAEAIRILRLRYPETPFVGLGYSLGAALLLANAHAYPEQEFDGLILLAPPVVLSGKTMLLRLLTPLRIFGFGLPSAAPKDYRVKDSTSFEMYHAVLEIADHLRARELPAFLKEKPILLVASEKDELLDVPEVFKYFERQQLRNLEILTLTPKPLRDDGFEHLIIDSDMLGEEEWKRLQSKIFALLEQVVIPEKKVPGPTEAFQHSNVRVLLPRP